MERNDVEFELAYYNVAIQHVSHNASVLMSKIKIWYVGVLFISHWR